MTIDSSVTEHPFAPFVRILGKGRKGSRSLTEAEAEHAMAMILAGEVRAEQLGAFLMLLRVKEESPEEIAGFVRAVRSHMGPVPNVQVDLDWACYAGKKRQPPWFLLVAKLLAERGVRVLMHGARGHTPGRVYAEDLLGSLGLSRADSLFDAAVKIEQTSFAYLPLAAFSPPLEAIIQLRSILGLRSPVHTLCRLLNPLDASSRIDGVFHPAYGPMHQASAGLLGHQRAVTLRGEGGEAEIKPDDDCPLQWVDSGAYSEQSWPRRYTKRMVKPEQLDAGALPALWRGESSDSYGIGAVIETLAVVIRLLRLARCDDGARQLAERWWHERRCNALPC